MKLREIAEILGCAVRSGRENLDKEVTGGYASDLLSDVLANSKDGDLWVTLQIHPNAVAVAFTRDLAGILLINGRQPEKETLAKAEKEGITILTTGLPAFEAIGKLFQLGISGKI